MTEELRNTFPEGTSKRRVINYATQQFFTKGVRQVTMDDIAKGLQMSKRTLYQLFSDKEELIMACIEVLTEEEHALALAVMQDHNVLEVILRILEFRLQHLEHLSPQYVIDVTRYDAVKEYIARKHEETVERSVKFLELGVQQGLFRSDVNFRLLFDSILSQLNQATSSPIFAKYGVKQYFINVGLFHLRGCCTAKGIELIDAFLDHYRTERGAK